MTHPAAPRDTRPSTFLLVHGSWHDARCWQPIIERLAQAGRQAVAVELPGRTGNRCRDRWTTMAACVASLQDAACRIDGPVHTVGHSLGGVVVARAAREVPALHAAQTYLSGYLLSSWWPLLLQTLGPPNGNWRTFFRLRQRTTGTLFYRLRDKKVAAALHNTCSPTVQAAAPALLDEPMWPLFSLGRPQQAGRPPLGYIHCLQDQTVLPCAQQHMVRRTPPDHSLDLDTDHSPFLSAPDALTATLLAMDAALLPDHQMVAGNSASA